MRLGAAGGAASLQRDPAPGSVPIGLGRDPVRDSGRSRERQEPAGARGAAQSTLREHRLPACRGVGKRGRGSDGRRGILPLPVPEPHCSRYSGDRGTYPHSVPPLRFPCLRRGAWQLRGRGRQLRIGRLRRRYSGFRPGDPARADLGRCVLQSSLGAVISPPDRARRAGPGAIHRPGLWSSRRNGGRGDRREPAEPNDSVHAELCVHGVTGVSGYGPNEVLP